MAHKQRTKRKKLWKGYRTMRTVTSTSSSTSGPPTIVIKRYVTCSTQTENNNLPHLKRKQFHIQDLESVNRISNIPIVETGWYYAENAYNKIKKWNNLMFWTLDQAETSVQTVFEAATPAIELLQGPISSIDKLVCKSLDIVEQTVPSINLPPQTIYSNTKKYVTDVGTKIARPVLKRADSVKQIGNTVLASKYTAFAADTLDGALDVAEKYVDKYLPAVDDQTNYIDHPVDGPAGKAIHTIHHATGFSRKLRRRLTQRTIAEVKALKHQSTEAVHVLVYVAELIATDPVLAFQKGKELWENLSKDEPENQARPDNLEQLIVLLTRESARRIVHLVNYSSTIISKIPKTVSYSVNNIVVRVFDLGNSMIKTIHLEQVQNTVVDVLKLQGHHLVLALKQVNGHVSDYLDQVAETLAKQEPQEIQEPKSALSVPQIKVPQFKATHTVHLKMTNSSPVHNKMNINGIENS